MYLDKRMSLKIKIIKLFSQTNNSKNQDKRKSEHCLAQKINVCLLMVSLPMITIKKLRKFLASIRKLPMFGLKSIIELEGMRIQLLCISILLQLLKRFSNIKVRFLTKLDQSHNHRQTIFQESENKDQNQDQDRDLNKEVEIRNEILTITLILFLKMIFI